MFSQTNLIKNGSFENFVNLNQPSFYGKFWAYNPTYTQIVDDWLTINSPDHFDTLFIPGGYNVPYSRFGYAYPKKGNSYAGICVYDIRFDYQEYPYQQIGTSLKKDSIYCLSYFIKRASRLPFAVKSIGALFSLFTPTLSGGYINAVPQIENNAGFITDTINWVEIKGCFTAQGGEQYITIGNFNSNANTDTLRIQSTNPLTGTGTDIAYYYIDSVSLWKNSFPVGIKEQGKNEFVHVYPNPANDIINFKFKDATEKRKIELYDAIGELVLSEDAPIQNSLLNIHHLSSGIYFYCIVQKNKTIHTNKIVIIK